MKVKKSVAFSTKEILKIIQKIPGLSKTQRIIIKNSYGNIVTGATLEAEWTEEEILDGIYQEK